LEGFLKLHAIGFGSLNLDEIWEVPHDLLTSHGLRPGAEYVRDVQWFESFYPGLLKRAALKAADPGGSAANTVAALYKMGFATGFHGAAGKNDLPAMRLHELGKREDLNIKQVALPAGRCLALIDKDDPDRDRALVILPNANDTAGSNHPGTDYFLRAQWLHLTSFVSTEPLAAQIDLVEKLSNRVRVSFDPGVIYSELGLSALEQILTKTEVLFTTEEELQMLTGCGAKAEAAAILTSIGVRVIVLKMGSKGLEAFHENVSVVQPAIPAATIRDRTGAGDVAAAGFLAGFIKRLSLKRSLELAALAASRSVEGFGRSAYPDKAFLDDVLSRWQSDRG
jgi:ribokinase